MQRDCTQANKSEIDPSTKVTNAALKFSQELDFGFLVDFDTEFGFSSGIQTFFLFERLILNDNIPKKLKVKFKV